MGLVGLVFLELDGLAYAGGVMGFMGCDVVYRDALWLDHGGKMRAMRLVDAGGLGLFEILLVGFVFNNGLLRWLMRHCI